jgi:hypothetical protein
MGMFDTICISDALPYSDEMKELGLDKYNDWQTKDLDCCMSVYFIQGGKLFEQNFKNSEWKEGDPKGESVMDRIGTLVQSEPYLEKKDFHGEIRFYDYIDDVAGKWDCWVEFKAIFTHGNLDRFELAEFKKTDSAERKENDRKFWEETKKRNSVWYNKFIFHTKAFRWFNFRVWFRFWSKVSTASAKIAHLFF